MKTKAVRLYGESDLRLEEFELPEITDGEILACVMSDSICMSSYKAAIQGAKHKRVPNDVAENPTIIEDFIRAIGATPVVYPYRNECCGGYISLKEKDMSKNMCERIMDSADGMGAEMLITACPLCLYNLKKNGNDKLPVVYFTELLAEALGVKEEVAK